MSSAQPAESSQPAQPAAKKKNNKKKKGNKPKLATEETKDDGLNPENDELSDSPTTPSASAPKQVVVPQESTSEAHANGHVKTPVTNGHPPSAPGSTSQVGDGPRVESSAAVDGDAHGKADTTAKEREALQAEVEQLKKQLQSIQETHEQELGQLRTDLEETEAAKEQAETQYQTLLGRVEKIKETLGDRLKRDKQELEEAKDRIEDLEAQAQRLTQANEASEAEAARLRDEAVEQGRELATLRSRSNLSQQNWHKERDELERQVAHLRGELESASTAMGEWEVIAMEERATREALADKAADLDEQVGAAREQHERAAAERDAQARAVDGLQRALQEIQEARKRELREMVESSEAQLQEARARATDADARAAEAEAARVALAREVERTAPFEKEVKEKNLLIGKLRHEAIVLNDHLTKALRYLMKTKPEESVDRQIVTNHFLQFLALDRSDPRKFQILQIIAGLLNWTDEQKEQAGLARPGGTSSGSLRLPASPFQRTPSNASLGADFFAEPTPSSASATRESLAELWTEFLERSANEAKPADSASSRKDSVSSSAAGTPRPETRGS